MSWLDSLITFFNPEAGAMRMAWRNAYEELRNYDAGDFSRINSHWRATNDSAEVTDRYSREWVRARARDLERNSDIMNSVLGAYKRNVIGSGFQIQAKTPRSELNKELEQLWKKWCKARNCDVTGVQSLNQMLRMAVVRKKVDGGVLFVKRYTKDGMIPFALQMIEVDELDSTQVSPSENTNRVVGGIEYNEYNRPVGYWVKQYAIDGYTIAETKFIKADDVIFYYSKKRPSQIREMSDMAQTATRIRDVNEFMNAVSVKQRIEACLSVFIKKQLPVSGIGRAGTAGPSDRFSYDGKTLTPGMIKELNAGDDVEVVNPTGQSADATSFVKLQQRLVGAGQGLSYEATSRDMSETNYASARQGAIEDEMTFQEEKEMILSILDEIYETFVISCVMSGVANITVKQFWDKKDDFLAHEWIQPPKKWIDPQKESGAMKTAMNAGVKTYKQICAENGVDWRTQLDDIAEVQEYAEKIGIGDFNSVMFDGKLMEEQQEGEENEETLTEEEGGEPPEDDGGEQPEDEDARPVKKRPDKGDQ